MPNVADIPAVEERIRVASRLISAHWDQASTGALDAALTELDEVERRGVEGLTRTEKAAIVIAILLLMRRFIDEPMPERSKARARRLSTELIEGGIIAGGGFGRLTRGGRTVRRMAARGAAELEALSRWRFRGDRIQERLDAAILDFLDHEEARRTAEERKAAEAADLAARRAALAEENARRQSEGKPALKVPEAPDAPQERKDGRDAAQDRRQWFDDLNKSLIDDVNTSSQAIADAWAYRQHNIGVYIALRAKGVRSIQAFNNPEKGPDDRTTRFCRWVHLKTIMVERIERQLDALAAAIRADDEDAIKRAWPMLNFRQSDSTQLYRQWFLQIGLPPYHWRCRTVAQEGRL